MRKAELQETSNESLIRHYERLAAKRGSELEAGSSRVANRAFDEEVLILRELDRREPDAVRLLIPLLKSADPWVRLDAATRLLFFVPGEAEPVLEKLGARMKALGFTAKWTLKEWRQGTLKPWWQK